jgi:hypothetical protein
MEAVPELYRGRASGAIAAEFGIVDGGRVHSSEEEGKKLGNGRLDRDQSYSKNRRDPVGTLKLVA